MSEVITLEAIEAKQAEVVTMIEKFKQRAVLSLPALDITLRPGERYAGAVLDEAGRITNHLILLPQKPGTRLTWPDAMAWARDLGTDLPTRQEQALLFANCKPHLEGTWHWSNEANGDTYAWGCYFNDGTQNFSRQSYEGGAVAVRRLNP